MLKRFSFISILLACAFAFMPATAEVPTFQYGCGCTGDSQDDSTLYADSVKPSIIKYVGYEISPTREEIAVSRTLQIAKADNSISTEAAPYDEWGKV